MKFIKIHDYGDLTRPIYLNVLQILAISYPDEEEIAAGAGGIIIPTDGNALLTVERVEQILEQLGETK